MAGASGLLLGRAGPRGQTAAARGVCSSGELRHAAECGGAKAGAASAPPVRAFLRLNRPHLQYSRTTRNMPVRIWVCRDRPADAPAVWQRGVG
jgi:hypothetical protein